MLKGRTYLAFAALVGAGTCAAAPGPSQSVESTASWNGAFAVAAPVPRGAMPMRRAGQVLPIAPGGCPDLAYTDGPVLSSVEIVMVYWEPSGQTVDPMVKSTMPNWFTQVTNSPYMDWLSEYNTTVSGGTNQSIVRGSFNEAVSITPSVTGTTVDDSQIGPEIVSQIQGGVLPQPKTDAQGHIRTLYMIYFPAGITITMQGAQSCVQFCAYHGAVMYNSDAIPYGVMPDMSPGSPCGGGGCGMQAQWIQTEESNSSHEMIEAVTDPQVALVTTCPGGANTCAPMAWYSDGSNCGEIADLCDPQGDGTTTGPDGTTQVVQLLWSNMQQKCTDRGTAPPVCVNGPNNPPGCRMCTAADNGAACNGSTPVCETRSGNIKLGSCVACVADSNCSGSTPICLTTSNLMTDDTCGNCTADPSICTGMTPVCAASGTNMGKCVQCDSTNMTQCTGGTPFCNAMTNVCRACTAADCTGATPVCDTSGTNAGQCVQCVMNSDCASKGTGWTCNTTTNTCVAPGGTGPDGGPAGGDGGLVTGDSGSPFGGGGGSDGGGNGATPSTTTTTCSCRVVGGPSQPFSAGGGVGILLGLAYAVRRRRRA